jgi:peptidoglycan/xylan/chitin deacetylase (PgdA/CDA1 family)
MLTREPPCMKVSQKLSEISPTKLLRSMPGKRDFVARVLGRLGVLAMLERAADARQSGPLILTYHRIAEPATDCFYDPVISATPETFRMHVKWLRGHVRLLTLDELMEWLENGLPWQEPVAMLTFDDGYCDNVEVAVPILQEFGVPATFFIPTAFLEAPKLPWWDQVAYILKKTQVGMLKVPYGPHHHARSLAIDLTATPRSEAITTVIRAFLDETISDGPWFLDHLRSLADVDLHEQDLGQALFMSWNQLQQLVCSGSGLAVGSHTHSHRKLAGLDDDSQLQELTRSKSILESRLGTQVRALAYPYGWSGTYTARTRSLAAEAGYRLAFTAQAGVNQPGRVNPYEIRRLGVGTGDSPMLLRARLALYRRLGRSFL